MPEFENFAMVAAKIAGIKTVPKMCSLEDKLLCACEDSYLPEKYIEQTKTTDHNTNRSTKGGLKHPYIQNGRFS